MHSNRIKKYLGYVIIHIKNSFIYKFNLLSSFLASIVEFVILLYIWTNIYESKSTIEGFSYSKMITYLCIAQGITAVYGWNNAIEGLVADRIQKGDILFDLLKPVNFTEARYAEGIGSSLIQILFVILILFFIKMLLPEFLGPPSLGQLLYFIISFIIGYFIMSSISLIVGLSSFILMNYWGVYYAKKAVVDLFSGSLVPFILLPPWFAKLCEILPFSKIVYIPTMIYLGEISGYHVSISIFTQLIWCVILYIAAQVVFKFSIKRVTINGG